MKRANTLTAICLTLGLASQGAEALPCGSVVLADHTLAADMNCAGTALFVGASNVTVDLAGHKIATTSSLNPAIAALAGPFSDVRIIGPGTIEAGVGGYGIVLDGVQRGSVTHLTIQGAAIAVSLYGSRETTIAANTFTSAPGKPIETGVFLSGATHNAEVTGNVFADGAVATLWGGKHVSELPSYNRVIGNRFFGDGDSGGVVILGGRYNTVGGNWINRTGNAVLLAPEVSQNHGASYNMVVGNFIETTAVGVRLLGSNDAGNFKNLIRDNVILGGASAMEGIAVGAPTDAGNILVQNTLRGYPAGSFIVDGGTATVSTLNTCDGAPC